MTKLSAFIITCGARNTLEACVKRASFADELWVVDKTSDNETGKIRNFNISKKYEAKYKSANWSPVVEDTREFAQSLCINDWILCLDDDEILSANAKEIIPGLISHEANSEIDIFAFIINHWIMGRYSHSETRPSLYRKGAVTYRPVVHAGNIVNGRGVVNNEVNILHLSHPDAWTFFEKSNRYTSVRNRSGTALPEHIGPWAMQVLMRKLNENSQKSSRYHENVAVMYAMYEIMDALKRYEDTIPDGNEEFAKQIQSIIDED